MLDSDYIAHLDGTTVIPGGWLNHNYRQFGIQLADSVAGGAYSFVGTGLILLVLDLIGRVIPPLRLRVSSEEEMQGIDDAELGEFAVSMNGSHLPDQSLTPDPVRLRRVDSRCPAHYKR